MKKNIIDTTQPQTFPNFVIFKIDNAKVNIDVLFQDETPCLTQKKMAELFETTPQNNTLHLKNIYHEDQLENGATCKEFLQVQKEGTSKKSKFKTVEFDGFRKEAGLNSYNIQTGALQ